MNYLESQIVNFQNCNAEVPEHLATQALVDLFMSGIEIDQIPEDYDPKETEDWEYIKESPAWNYAASDDELAEAILSRIEMIREREREREQEEIETEK
jgi:hypothetical protein